MTFLQYLNGIRNQLTMLKTISVNRHFRNIAKNQVETLRSELPSKISSSVLESNLQHVGIAVGWHCYFVERIMYALFQYYTSLH